MKRLAILISGRGSNMQALLEARLPATISRVISNTPGARGLDIAKSHGVETAVVDHRAHSSRDAFDAALAAEIERAEADVIALAGFMRILTPAFVERFAGRMLNIHPSLLPAFAGLDTHRRALEAGARIHGCTVHFVTRDLDGGPIVAQAAVPVKSADTEEALAARVLEQEHRIYPAAVRWLCEGRIRIGADGRVDMSGVTETEGALISPRPDA